jgi:group I intron endonuclease
MYIYKILNIKENKCYIGQTSKQLGKRLYKHLLMLRNNRHDNIFLQRAWNKYGEESFVYSILDKASSVEELNEKEIMHIEKHKSLDAAFGYNLTAGGYGLRDWKPSQGWRNRRSEVMKLNNPMKGKTHSEETKKEWSRKRKGSKPTRLGAKASDETRKKMSLAQTGKHKGELNIRYGVKLEKELKTKIGMSQPKRIEILVVNLDKMISFQFRSVNFAAKQLGLCEQKIRRGLKKNRQTSDGYYFKKVAA